MKNWAKLVPELLVLDLQKSLHFWVDLIGFSVAYERPGEGFAYLDLDGAQIMLDQRSEARRQWVAAVLDPPLGRGVNFQIEVPAIQPILERLAGSDWPLFMEVEDAWYQVENSEHGQRQFLVQDPDGYLARLMQDLGERQTR